MVAVHPKSRSPLDLLGVVALVWSAVFLAGAVALAYWLS